MPQTLVLDCGSHLGLFEDVLAYNFLSTMRRSYWQYGEMKTGKLANVYFHCKVECAKLVQPAFATLIKGLLKILHNQLSVFILFISQNSSHKNSKASESSNSSTKKLMK